MSITKRVDAVSAIVAILVQHDESERAVVLEAVRAIIASAPASKPKSAIDYLPRPHGAAAK